LTRQTIPAVSFNVMSDQDFPFLEPDHLQLSDDVKSLNESSIRVAMSRDDEDEAALELVKVLARGGLLNYAAPDESKGGKLDVRSVCVIREQLSYESSLADLMFAMQGLGSYPISIAGSRDLKSAFLPRVREGRAIAAFAITEPDAGSDVASMQTTARADGDHFVLDGTKTFISNAGLADFYTVFAKTKPELGAKGISAFVVEKQSPGFSVEERIQLIAPHPIGRIRFNSCRVPSSNLLGREDEGLKVALTTLDTFRPSVGAAACGMAKRALDEAIKYSKRRVQFGKPISEHQAIQLKIAEMATKLEAARLLVYRAAHKKDRGASRITTEAAMAKLFATEVAQSIIDEAVQIHGGAGLVRGATVEHLYRDIRALRIYEGTSEIQKLIIAGKLLSE